MAKDNFDYDKSTDSLFISRRKDNEKVQGSAEIGNIILDFSSNGRILSIEFIGISKLLTAIKIEKNILEKLKEVDLFIQEQKGAVFIYAILKTSEIEERIPLANIPLKRALMPSV